MLIFAYFSHSYSFSRFHSSKIIQVTRDMGLGPVVAGDPGARGAGDVSFVAEFLPCLDGLGASGKGAHSIEETINLKEYPTMIQRTAITIYRLTR